MKIIILCGIIHNIMKKTNKRKRGRNIAIILAGGIGSRFSDKINKSFALIKKKPAIFHVLKTYEKHHLIDEIVIVINQKAQKKCKKLVVKEKFKKVKKIVTGGSTRQESTRIGLYACQESNPQKVLIQEAVRPLTSAKIISDTIYTLNKFVGCVATFSSSDAIIKFNKQKIIQEIPEKKFLGRGQSPEGFRFGIIKKAHDLAYKEGFRRVSDNCALVLKYKLGNMCVININYDNLKITHPWDHHIINQVFKIKTKK